ncbi:HD domain-containing protein [Candidatus Saccharibacteria bacterium]|nr:HD domain-containing protein [Candidatus Saccharibacteria bacterium]
MSAAQILWDNWSKYDDLDRVYRQGFLVARIYGFGNEAKSTIDKYHVESTLTHSGRVGMLFSDMMDLWPAYFEGIDKYSALKVALNHDIGELAVGDVVDDGRTEHEDKKDPEWQAVQEHYFSLPEETYLKLKTTHREFEKSNTFLGQSIKLADKLDFIAELIKLSSDGYIMGNRQYFTEGDLALAKEIHYYNLIDACGNHLRHLVKEHDFDQRLVQIAVQFLTCGLETIDRPFFKWWQPDEYGRY